MWCKRNLELHLIAFGTLAFLNFPFCKSLPLNGSSIVERVPKQDTTGGGGAGAVAAAAGGIGAQYGTYANVGTILNGVAEGDILHIISGGTNFIPAGDLRNGVNMLIQNALIPTAQRVASEVVQGLVRSFNQTTTSTGTPLISNIPTATPLPARSGAAIAAATKESSFNPLQAIRDRLQSLIPSFSLGGGGSSSSSSSSSSNSRGGPVYIYNLQNSNSNDNNKQIDNNNNNNYDYDIPESQGSSSTTSTTSTSSTSSPISVTGNKNNLQINNNNNYNNNNIYNRYNDNRIRNNVHRNNIPESPNNIPQSPQ